MIVLPTSISLVFPHPFVRRLSGGPGSTTPAPVQHAARTIPCCAILFRTVPLPTGIVQVVGSAVGCHLAGRQADRQTGKGMFPARAKNPSASAAD